MSEKSAYRLNLKLLHDDLSEYYKDTKQFEDDSGVDLYFPEDVTIPGKAIGINVGLGVACEMCRTVTKTWERSRWGYMVGGTPRMQYSAYWILPRSSLSKTPLRLSNSIGLVDKGYRGELRAALDNLSDEPFTIKKGTRLFQLAHPKLIPLEVNIVTELSETKRGSGGFGSTGK